MKNYEWCVYTYRHRKAFEYTAKKLIRDPKQLEEILRRAVTHDMDKMLLYLFFDQYESQKQHVMSKPHHLENRLPRSYMDYLETVIDYECAPYTKPDKPLNAYDFVKKIEAAHMLDEETLEKLFGIMRDLGIDSSYDLTQDEEGMAYMRSIGEISEETILFEILKYVDENRDNSLSYVRERLGL